MKRISIYLILAFIFIFFVSNCTTDDNEIIEQYKTGVIKFDYQKSEIINGLTVSTDTTISFTSIGNNISEADVYGYAKPSSQWVQMIRLNPNDYNNWGMIFFSGTNLNSLTLPYTFSSGDVNTDAQINYVVDSNILIDSTGQQFLVTNTYAATTYSNNFELTILSLENNRLQGSFNGEIKNQDGHIINIIDGIFDVQIVEK
jgi:phenolic acid decarboxylase